MAFHFNPSLWFVCKLCRESFPDTDKLKAHKLESHLEESLNIKCIVFEEKLLDHEWIPPSQEFTFKPDQLISTIDAPPKKSNHDPVNVKSQVSHKIQQYSRFKNPYVSLKVLTAQELNSASTTASRTKNIGGAKSTFGSTNSLEFKGENIAFLTKRRLNSVSETNPFPSQLPKTEEKDDDDAHKDKIRELLSNAVIIKSESNNDSNVPVFLKPQDLPISIVPTYSIPSSSNSTIINSLNKNLTFNSLQRDTESDNLNIFDITLSAAPAITATTSMTDAFNGKVEFIEYNSVANQEVEIRSTKQLTQISHVNHNSSLPLKAQSTSVRRRSDKKLHKRYICPICSAAFSKSYNLAQHKLTHSNHRAFPCPKCDSRFKTKDTLRNHLISIHGQASAFRCHLCNKFFPSKGELASHAPFHSLDRPHLCDFPNCGVQFKSSRNLNVHTRMQHGKDLGLEQFECPTCGDTFGLRKGLNAHQRKTHQTPDVQILP